MGFFDWLGGLFGGNKNNSYNPLNDYDFEDTVTLTNNDGEDVDFSYIDGCKIGNKYYAVLELPVEGEENGEFSCWEVTHEDDGNYFQIVNDGRLEDKIIDTCRKNLENN